jgi:ABC-type Mn2+/Zn2+ transport system ATPase subunit
MKKEVACGHCCTKIDGISVKIGKEYIIKNINIHIHCGHLSVIIGPNGAGKTTLLKALIGEIKHEGKILFVDEKDNKTKKIKMGYVPQKLNIEKNNPTSVYDLFASGTTNKPIFLFRSETTYNVVKKHLENFGAEMLIDKKLGDLSGGELQRVLLAFATISNPELLILDEPVSGIDNNGMEIFYKLIDDLKKKLDIAIILVSHDFKFVKKYADRVIMIDKEIICEGTSSEVFSSKEFNEYFGNNI